MTERNDGGTRSDEPAEEQEWTTVFSDEPETAPEPEPVEPPSVTGPAEGSESTVVDPTTRIPRVEAADPVPPAPTPAPASVAPMPPPTPSATSAPAAAPPSPPTRSAASTGGGDAGGSGSGLLKKVLGGLAALVPIAVGGFIALSNGDAPTDVLCENAPVDASAVCDDVDAVDDTVASEGDEGSDGAAGEDVVVTDEAGASDETAATTDGTPETAGARESSWPAGIDAVSSNGARGAGCQPAGDVLEDGVWFGLLTSVTSAVVEFDLACAFSELQGDAQADARGEARVRPYFVTNDVTTLRTVPVSPDAIGRVQNTSGAAGPALAFADVVAGLDVDAGDVAVWIYVEDGQVVEVVQQTESNYQFARGALDECGSESVLPGTVVEVVDIPADDPDKGLNIRTAPRDGDVITAAANGTTFSTLSGCRVLGSTTWWQVSGNGITGWASATYLDPVD